MCQMKKYSIQNFTRILRMKRISIYYSFQESFIQPLCTKSENCVLHFFTVYQTRNRNQVEISLYTSYFGRSVKVRIILDQISSFSGKNKFVNLICTIENCINFY